MYVGYVKIRRTFSVSFCPTKFKLLSLLRYVESSVKYENDFGFVFVFVCLFVFVVFYFGVYLKDTTHKYENFGKKKNPPPNSV